MTLVKSDMKDTDSFPTRRKDGIPIHLGKILFIFFRIVSDFHNIDFRLPHCVLRCANGSTCRLKNGLCF